MAWHLIIAPRELRDLDGLTQRDRDAVDRALARLLAEPGSADLKKLLGRSDEWRLRVGSRRAILRLDNSTGTIVVLRVLPRSVAYRE